MFSNILLSSNNTILTRTNVMFFAFLLAGCLSFAHVGSTAAQNCAPDVIYLLPKPDAPSLLNGTNSTLDQPALVQVSNISSNYQHGITCDSRLGTGLNPTSCMEVLNLIRKNRCRHKVGQRGSGDFDINLPYRWISCGFKVLHVLPRYANVTGSGWDLCH